MHLSSISAAFVATLAFGQSASAISLGNGLWSGTNYDNGTTVYASLSDPSLAPVVVHYAPGLPERSVDMSQDSAKLRKRFVDCWGYALDASGIDKAVGQLKNWAGRGHDLSSPGDGNRYVFFESEAMWVYYCINAHNSKGNLDTDDVNYALGQMDAKCPRYTASYFRWDNTPEIVGKCKAQERICLG